MNGQRLKHYRAGDQLYTEEKEESDDDGTGDEPNASSGVENQ